MPTENHGITRLNTRSLYLQAGSEEDIAVSGNAVLSRLRHGEAQLPDSMVQRVHAHLDRVLHSAHFDGSTRSREFLRYVVEEVLADAPPISSRPPLPSKLAANLISMSSIPSCVQAGRLRRSLERYYLLSSDLDSIRIELPKGSYAPVFVDIVDARPPPSPRPKQRATGRPS